MIPSETAARPISRRTLLRVILACVLVGLVLIPFGAAQVLASTPEVQADIDWGRMPLYFIANQGQLDEVVSYYVQGSDKTLYFTPQGLTFSLAVPASEEDEAQKIADGSVSENSTERWTVKLDYLGAREVIPQGEAETEAVISYFKGDPEDWKTGIPTYSSVIYQSLWEGIDLKYSGNQDQLKQEFVLAPGADTAQIQLSYQGASLTLNDQGELEVSTPAGTFTDEAPIAYQVVEGQRVEVPVDFVLGEPTGFGAQETTGYSFGLGDYDPGLPLVIDPTVLVYCGYIGGSSVDFGQGIAVDGDGCAYVTGYAYSTESSFPVLGGPDTTHNGGTFDAFVAKVAADGTALVYCGYIGGSGGDEGYGIAVDGDGCAYVTGHTSSTESTFPVLGGPDTTHNGGYDAFVAKVNAGGTALVYCGYIGGSGGDQGYGIAVDGDGCAYVTGRTSSTESTFPVLGGPDTTHNGGDDAFVAKVDAGGTALDYCGYIGGADGDYGRGIAVDASGCAYITGYTSSTESTFPVLGGPDTTHNGGDDAFVAKVNAGGTALVYCGYIGGSGDDQGSGIAVDGDGCAYVTGRTSSTESSFPVLGGPDTTHNGGTFDAFVAKVNAGGTALVYCGYIGGSGGDEGYGIAVDGDGCAYVTGHTSSTESTFPVLGGPDTTHNGDPDAFVAKVAAGGTELVYCGYIGGSDPDYGYGIAVDASGNAYVIGTTYSAQATFPETAGPDTIYNGLTDAFVAKVRTMPVVTGVIPNTGLTTGGTLVIITGTDLIGVTEVKFGDADATEFIVASATRIFAILPAHAEGVVDVRVANAAATSANTAADDFTFLPVPTITGLSPTSGPTTGGTSVTITGTDFTGATDVTFGATAASTYTVDTPTQITATAPDHTAGAVQVQVTTPYGASADTSADDFTYVDPPAITGLSPAAGPTTGGTSVTITGTDFTGATDVTFGATAAVSYTVDTPTQITAASPVGSLGTVQVEVTTPYGFSADTAADDFTYLTMTRYQQDDAKISYLGPWATGDTWAASGGSFASTSQPGAAVVAKFSGTDVSVLAKKCPWYGKVRISVDGGSTQTVDLYDSTQAWKQTVYAKTGLAYGVHTLTIECLGTKNASSLGTAVCLDALDIGGELAQAPKTTRIQDDNPAYCVYDPVVWLRWDRSGYWAASEDTYAYSDKDGAKITVTFHGTFASWVACTSKTKGKAQVTIDPGTADEKIATVDLYSPITTWKKTVYSTGLLADGPHTVVIECLGEKNWSSWWYTIGVDAFDIMETPE